MLFPEKYWHPPWSHVCWRNDYAGLHRRTLWHTLFCLCGPKYESITPTLRLYVSKMLSDLACLNSINSRGRVGRGHAQSYCYLLSDNANAQRLRALERTNDGFEISEIDMQLRGPGEVYGVRQSRSSRSEARLHHGPRENLWNTQGYRAISRKVSITTYFTYCASIFVHFYTISLERILKMK